MLIPATFTCAYCFETVHTTVDPSGGGQQEYVEDCQVCCRANLLRITVDAYDQTAYVQSELAYD